MTDVPPGHYSAVLVGHVWPSNSSLDVIRQASAAVAGTAAAYHRLREQLRQTRIGPLADQTGVTADDVCGAFERGEAHARDIAEKHDAKRAAFDGAHDAAAELRSQLAAIADDGNARISRIHHSKDPLPDKIDQIVDTVLQCQGRATAAAAPYGQDILGAVQRVLDRAGVDTSARQFAAAHGIDTPRLFAAPNGDRVREHVTALLAGPAPAPAAGALTWPT
ncbi:hypothetical protein [Mycobacterium sp.]|uniref:hypothetical protein n=1 Tax=Mycobacterium sp. TaxID=1785 RepID=UPI0031CE77A2